MAEAQAGAAKPPRVVEDSAWIKPSEYGSQAVGCNADAGVAH